MIDVGVTPPTRIPCRRSFVITMCVLRLIAPVSAAELIRSHIPDASMTVLEAAHISNVEQSHAFTEAVLGFLTQR